MHTVGGGLASSVARGGRARGGRAGGGRAGGGLRPPAWVFELVERGAAAHECIAAGRDIKVRAWRGEKFTLVQAAASGAGDLESLDFQHRTIQTYRAIATVLRERRGRADSGGGGGGCPVRFWNFIPDIGAAVGTAGAGAGELDRYMIFNAARYAAYVEWYGAGSFGDVIATATGVGHRGLDLHVWCLAAQAPGIAIENPRQVPAYRYSEQYGPLPPSFVRATLLEDGPEGQPVIFVGGTASIRGERSAHREDLERQAHETIENLAAIVAAASERFHREGEPARPELAKPNGSHVNGVGCEWRGDEDWLALFRRLRVYYVQREHGAPLEALLARTFPAAREIEWVQADLCRRELLVEIEGVADAAPRPVRQRGPIVAAGAISG